MAETLQTRPAPHVQPEASPSVINRPPRRRGAHRVQRRDRTTGDVLFVVLSTGAANVVLYLFPAVIAQTYSPATFGLFSSLFGIVVLFGLGATAIQTSVASRVSNATDESRPQVLEAVWRRMLVLTIVMAGLLLAASPVIESTLRVDHYTTVLSVILVACTLAPWSSLLGAFQGLQRFRALGFLTLLQACTRLLATTVMLMSSNLSVLFLAVAASVIVSFFAGALLLGDLRRTLRVFARVRGAAGASSTSAGGSSLGWSLLTVFAVSFPTVVDVIFVRHFYSPHDAGLYASVALVGRCIIFLPVGINAVIFPRYSATSTHRKRMELRNYGLAVACLLCGFGALILGMRPGLTIDLLVGQKYAEAAGILRLYLLASLGFALVSVFAFYELARANKRYSVGVLLPYLLVLSTLPAVIGNLKALVFAMTVLALSLLACSAVVSRLSRPT